jgi:CDGSH-type Zn-finger protein
METNMPEASPSLRIQVASKGPYLIKGKCIIVDEQGREVEKEGTIALCRCGLSKNKPYCDGTHRTTNVLG